MIKRVYIKDYLNLCDIELEFDRGLNVFSGASGAGKSIFMSALLSAFGFGEAKSSLIELNLTNLTLPQEFLSDDDEILLKQIKKDKTRFFLNHQSISKNKLKELGFGFLFHLNHKNDTEFDNKNLISLLDGIIVLQEDTFLKTLNSFKELFSQFKQQEKELFALEQKAKKSQELKEFIQFEIEKIENINPKEGEDEELQKIKKLLSKKDKIQESISLVEGIFGFESYVNKLYELMNKDTSLFDDAMNELRDVIEYGISSTQELEEINIEEMLERIEKIGELKRRFGGIKEALEYKENKKQELDSFEKLDDDIKFLSNKLQEQKEQLAKLSSQISHTRKKYLLQMQNSLNEYLKMLYMPNSNILITPKQMSEEGVDKIDLAINHTQIDNLSSGELNRLRLALLALRVKYQEKTNTQVLILDEIDANLSGEESKSVAGVLEFLSKSFQIFAISHQPHLASVAHSHYLVQKQNNQKSSIVKLNKNQRVDEIARIIGGKNPTKEAFEYAKRMIKC